MVLSKYTPAERLVRKRLAARLRQQRCRARKKAAAAKELQDGGRAGVDQCPPQISLEKLTMGKNEPSDSERLNLNAVPQERPCNFRKEGNHKIMVLSSPAPARPVVRYAPPPQSQHPHVVPRQHQPPPPYVTTQSAAYTRPPPSMAPTSSSVQDYYSARPSGVHVRRVSTSSSSHLSSYGMHFSAPPPPPPLTNRPPPPSRMASGAPVTSYEGPSRTIVVPAGAHVVVHAPPPQSQHPHHHRYMTERNSGVHPSHYHPQHPASTGPPPPPHVIPSTSAPVHHHSPKARPIPGGRLQDRGPSYQPVVHSQQTEHYHYPAVVSRTSSRDDSTHSLSSNSASSPSSSKRALEDQEDRAVDPTAYSSPADQERPLKRTKSEDVTETPKTLLWNKEKAAIAAMLTLGNADTTSDSSLSGQDGKPNDSRPVTKAQDDTVKAIEASGHHTISATLSEDSSSPSSTKRNPIIGIMVPVPYRDSSSTVPPPHHASAFYPSGPSSASAFRAVGGVHA